MNSNILMNSSCLLNECLQWVTHFHVSFSSQEIYLEQCLPAESCQKNNALELTMLLLSSWLSNTDPPLNPLITAPFLAISQSNQSNI